MKNNKPDPEVLSLRKLFNEADPQGIFLGDNHDEYDPEISAIVNVLPQCDSPAKIKSALWSVFKEKFGPDIAGPESDYEALSQALFNWRARQSA